ncbi:MAG: SDR family oxidoreductase [Syntrophaceae bacterium]|nr:SDR family oxidoreductase [Syntrophaceae bacterium]
MQAQRVLSGRVGIVTGAGRGIGRAIALAFARQGASVVVTSRTFSEIEETAAQVRALGSQALAIQADVSSQSNVNKIVEQTIQAIGTVDILVNNAGVQGPIGSIDDNDADHWIRTVMINLIGTFLCCRAVLAVMMKQQRGKIINLSGGGATSPRPNFSAYASSKAALVRFTETLAEEVKPFNIQVNAIAPGAINTRMLDEVLAAGDAAGEVALSQAKKQKQSGGDSLEAVVALAVFLASDESGGLTGKLISAQHDPWREWVGKDEQLNASPLYTIRRLDPFTIKPLIKDLDY